MTRVPTGDYQKVKNDPAMALQLTQVDTFPQITNFGCFLMIYQYSVILDVTFSRCPQVFSR